MLFTILRLIITQNKDKKKYLNVIIIFFFSILSFRNFGTPKYPESRSYARRGLYLIFTSEFCIMNFGSRQRWREPRRIECSCVAFHTISGVVRMQRRDDKLLESNR